MRIEITYELAYAASHDAGNRRMRANGRTKWSRGDYNAAIRKFNRLWPEPLGPDRITKGDMRLAQGVIREQIARGAA